MKLFIGLILSRTSDNLQSVISKIMSQRSRMPNTSQIFEGEESIEQTLEQSQLHAQQHQVQQQNIILERDEIGQNQSTIKEEMKQIIKGELVPHQVKGQEIQQEKQEDHLNMRFHLQQNVQICEASNELFLRASDKKLDEVKESQSSNKSIQVDIAIKDPNEHFEGLVEEYATYTFCNQFSGVYEIQDQEVNPLQINEKQKMKQLSQIENENPTLMKQNQELKCENQRMKLKLQKMEQLKKRNILLLSNQLKLKDQIMDKEKKKTKQIEGLNQSLKQKTKQMEGLNQYVKEYSREIAQLLQKINEYQQKIRAKDVQIQSLKIENKQSYDNYKYLYQFCQKLDKEKEDLQNNKKIFQQQIYLKSNQLQKVNNELNQLKLSKEKIQRQNIKLLEKKDKEIEEWKKKYQSQYQFNKDCRKKQQEMNEIRELHDKFVERINLIIQQQKQALEKRKSEEDERVQKHKQQIAKTQQRMEQDLAILKRYYENAANHQKDKYQQQVSDLLAEISKLKSQVQLHLQQKRTLEEQNQGILRLYSSATADFERRQKQEEERATRMMQDQEEQQLLQVELIECLTEALKKQAENSLKQKQMWIIRQLRLEGLIRRLSLQLQQNKTNAKSVMQLQQQSLLDRQDEIEKHLQVSNMIRSSAFDAMSKLKLAFSQVTHVLKIISDNKVENLTDRISSLNQSFKLADAIRQDTIIEFQRLIELKEKKINQLQSNNRSIRQRGQKIVEEQQRKNNQLSEELITKDKWRSQAQQKLNRFESDWQILQEIMLKISNIQSGLRLMNIIDIFKEFDGRGVYKELVYVFARLFEQEKAVQEQNEMMRVKLEQKDCCLIKLQQLNRELQIKICGMFTEQQHKSYIKDMERSTSRIFQQFQQSKLVQTGEMQRLKGIIQDKEDSLMDLQRQIFNCKKELKEAQTAAACQRQDWQKKKVVWAEQIQLEKENATAARERADKLQIDVQKYLGDIENKYKDIEKWKGKLRDSITECNNLKKNNAGLQAQVDKYKQKAEQQKVVEKYECLLCKEKNEKIWHCEQQIKRYEQELREAKRIQQIAKDNSERLQNEKNTQKFEVKQMQMKMKRKAVVQEKVVQNNFLKIEREDQLKFSAISQKQENPKILQLVIDSPPSSLILEDESKFFLDSHILSNDVKSNVFLVNAIEKFAGKSIVGSLLKLKMVNQTINEGEVSKNIGKENILWLFKKGNNIFGAVSFEAKIRKDLPTILISLTNQKVAYPAEQFRRCQSIKKQLIFLTFGLQEARFVWKSKTMMVASDSKKDKYFDVRVPLQADIFGGERIDVQQFEVYFLRFGS